MSVTEYLQTIERMVRLGNATEHTFRPAFQALLESLADVEVTNEPKRAQCGAPDYVITRPEDHLTLGYVEAKDVGADLAAVEKGEQLKRYQAHLPNLLLTDYLEVRWYVLGERGTEKRGRAALGCLTSARGIVSNADEQARALQLLRSFLTQRPVVISSASELALRLAHLTHMVRDTMVEAFGSGQASDQLRDWRAAFAATLLPELAPQSDPKAEVKVCAEFADMFAQTLSYGLFSARAAGPGGKFTREQARKLIPRTNPFLRHFFEQITGSALDEEPFAGFVEDIIQTLDVAGMEYILADFGKRGRRSDPVVHFYETFLQAYDPKLRELRGVYYTPEPVVNYIVESLDFLLKSKFGLKDGLADRSQITVTRREGEREIKETSHRVLILDPATGTATFLYRVLDFMREQFERKKRLGAWGEYVHEHLLPRLFVFELLMAPYAVAHFKIGLALGAWDKEPLFRQGLSYEPKKGERINIFLTNTLEDLEETAQQLGPLRMLSDEANAAFEIKQNKPVLVILGNPPYSNFGQQNRGQWILGLLDDYKRGLKEKKINLNDDFIKFIRWGQWRIEQTGSGLLGFITNNVYLDGLTHRRMRESLLEAFDEIYVVNLHGSGGARKREAARSEEKDENVFDITVGVSILILVKVPNRGNKGNKPHADVHHADLWGRRDAKYQWLDAHAIENTAWAKLAATAPEFLLVPPPKGPAAEYQDYIGLRSLFPVSGNGIKTERDGIAIRFSREEMSRVVEDFRSLEEGELRRKFGLGDDSRDWSIARAKQDAIANQGASLITEILYRPLDERFTWYSGKSKGFIGTPASALMHHLLSGPNMAFVTTRQTKDEFGILATQRIAGHKSLRRL